MLDLGTLGDVPAMATKKSATSSAGVSGVARTGGAARGETVIADSSTSFGPRARQRKSHLRASGPRSAPRACPEFACRPRFGGSSEPMVPVRGHEGLISEARRGRP